MNQIKLTTLKAKKKKGPPSKGSLAKSHQATNQLIEQLSLAVLRFLQPESTSPVKATSPVKSVGINRPLKTGLKLKGLDTQANRQENGQTNRQANGQAIQTRSGRVSVRRVIFEAGKN